MKNRSRRGKSPHRKRRSVHRGRRRCGARKETREAKQGFLLVWGLDALVFPAPALLGELPQLVPARLDVRLVDGRVRDELEQVADGRRRHPWWGGGNERTEREGKRNAATCTESR